MTDDEVFEGIIAGDQAAWDEFYKATRETAERVCAYFLGEDESMLAAVVGAYKKAVDHLKKKGKPEYPMRAWISILAVQECFPVMDRHLEDYNSQSKVLEEMAGKVPVLQEITSDEKERMNFMIRGEVEDMPDPHRQFLTLSELDGLSFSEIAKRLSLSWIAVVNRMYAARAVLVQKVKDQLGL
jgi:DNA-directed RNA polymerase specialized sigma24 family protein